MILDGNDPSAIATAARALRSGALLGLPTETVYGLAADASSDAAVAQIFAAKGRPSDHPLIVHVADASAIAHFASAVPVFAQALVDAFWPGPLTLILPRRPDRARAATGGQDSVGLRCPAHPVARAVLQACAASGDNDAAVAQIFAAKGRPSDHPLIVHVADASAVAHFASAVPVFAQALVDAFWPGPLTLILPRRPDRARAATGGQDSVGLRCPAHPVAQAVLHACAQDGPALAGAPVWGVAAPSANRFGRVSPTTAAHVQAELGDALLVLDGGPCAVGIESTIVDCTRGVPVLLRPGAITRAQIEAACGMRPLSKEELPALTPRASGTLLAHYAPNAKVRLMDARALQAGLDLLGQDAAHLAVYARTPLRTAKGAQGVQLRRMPDNAEATAAELFAVLRELDNQGTRLLWIESPPDTPDWEGVRDRLQRAAAA